jgi:hypothetical protein
MKSYSLVKFSSDAKGTLANPEKSEQELQNADLSRPSTEVSRVNMVETGR